MTTARNRAITALVAVVLALLVSAGSAVAVVVFNDEGTATQRSHYADRHDNEHGPRGPWMGDPGSHDRRPSARMGQDGWAHGPMTGTARDRQRRIHPWRSERCVDAKTHGMDGAGQVTSPQFRQKASRWQRGFATRGRCSERDAMPMGFRSLVDRDCSVGARAVVGDDPVWGHRRAPIVPR